MMALVRTAGSEREREMCNVCIAKATVEQRVGVGTGTIGKTL
jgi:hypothetical protein